jgi:hypothetical protein
MLIHPVRRVRPDHAVVPPRPGLDVTTPGGRRIPVVAQIVIVENHARRDARQQRPHRLESPRFPIEPRVLLEVADLVLRVGADGTGRSLSRLPSRLQSFDYLGRRVVGVHLVTQKQQGLGPLARILLDEGRSEPGECIGTDRLQRLRAVIVAAPTRPERKRDRPRCVHGVDAGSLAILRPHPVLVDEHLVAHRRVGGQALEWNERKVVTVHSPRSFRCSDADIGHDGDGARVRHLEPQGRGLGADITNDRAE